MKDTRIEAGIYVIFDSCVFRIYSHMGRLYLCYLKRRNYAIATHRPYNRQLRHSNEKKLWIGFVLVLIISCVWETILFVTRPETKTGPFGIGLPAKMKLFESKTFDITIQYPESWVAFETPGGNHGDKEEIIGISVPGRTWPNLRIAKRDFVNGDLDQVIQWGLARLNNLKGVQRKDIQVGTPLTVKTSTLTGKYLIYSYKGTSLLGEREAVCHSYFFYEHESGYMVFLCSDKDSWEKLGDVESKMTASLTLP